MSPANDGSRFDRLPPTAGEREVDGRPSRADVLRYFEECFGIDEERFAGHTFWEKGRGKIWAFHGTVPDPLAVEALGIHLLRTRQRHWKPTTDAMQAFGGHATRNVVELTSRQANRFWRGDTVSIDWSADPAYVIATAPIADTTAPLGVGLARADELESLVPKGRQRDLEPPAGRR